MLCVERETPSEDHRDIKTVHGSEGPSRLKQLDSGVENSVVSAQCLENRHKPV